MHTYKLNDNTNITFEYSDIKNYFKTAVILHDYTQNEQTNDMLKYFICTLQQN